jgi:glycosyltransferase involved in cell wall biosynthesis
MSVKVSVLMTAFNREKYIGEAIESVLASTYKDFELIIVDDQSTDNTVPIIKKYAEADPRIRFYRNEKNLGDYPNRNCAAGHATGEIMMTVDSDDTLFPESILKAVELMDRYPNVGFGICNEQQSEALVLNGKEALQQHFFQKPLLLKGPGGTVLRREYFSSIGKYPVKYGPANDMYFNLKAAASTDVLLIPFEFIYYRRHEGQEINNHGSYLYNRYRYLRDALNELDLHLDKKQTDWLHKKNKRRFAVNISKYFLATFNFRKTRNAVRLADFGFRDYITGIFH